MTRSAPTAAANRRSWARPATSVVTVALVALVSGCAADAARVAAPTTSADREAANTSAPESAPPPPVALGEPTPPGEEWPGGLTPSLVIPIGDATVSALHAADGALWAIAGDHAVAIDPSTGMQTSSFPVETGSSSLAVAGEWLWVAAEESGKVAQYHLPDGTAGTVMQTGMPSGLLAAHGSVWVSQHHDGTVLRIDPATGESTEIMIVGEGRSGPQTLLADEQGVFVAVPRDNALYRVDAATEDVEKLKGEAFACGGMAKVDEVVWGTGCFSGPWVAGFDAVSRQPAGKIELGDRYGESLALVGNDLWASVAVETEESGKFHTSRAALVLLDPEEKTVVRTHELLDGGGVTALAGDRLWLVGKVGNTILRFDTEDLAAAGN